MRTSRDHGRLQARPGLPAQPATVGSVPLGLGGSRDGLLYVPASYQPGQALPLVLMLHGAGGSAAGGMAPLRPLADAAGLILLAIDSRGRTWDVILGGFGADVEFIEEALAWTFERCAVDPRRLAVGGFSDGASYALSLGITNGDLFSHVLAFAPGFLAPAAQRGAPRIFIAHGTGDPVLPIERCSRQIVPQLRSARYEVEYREFEDGHTVPASIAREAVEWFQRF